MMTALSAFSTLAATFGFAVGLALGLAYFASLRRVTDLYLSEKGAGRGLTLQLARFAGLAVALAALAQVGAMALLAGTLGLLAARAILLRRVCGSA